MDFSDLLVVLVLASALYALLVALSRQRHFLAKAVNPHRASWLVAALGIIWVGFGILRLEAQSWSLATWSHLVRQLVTEEPTPARVKVASLAILMGVTFLLLVAWCQLFLPRDPSTFRRPEDRKAAFRYYVARLRGGLDYALLACGDGEQLEEAVDVKQTRMRCPHLPKVQVAPSEPPRCRTVDDQVEFWRQMARLVHQRMPELDALIEPARQGHNRRLVFDAEFGGFFFKYLRAPDPRSKVDTGLYLFAATLNQVELDNQRAEQHFHLLLEALQQIDRGIRVS
jgi:hypothetical protein